MPEIPEPLDAPALDTLPTEAVAELPQDTEAPEAKPYKISFASYKEGECEIDGMRKPNAVVALKMVRDIGLHFTNETNLVSHSRWIDEIKHVFGQGDYGRLFRGLADDIEIREIKYVRESRDDNRNIDLRLFFYTIEDERTFYVIAVRQSHYNLR